MSEIEDLQIELENALKEIAELKSSTYPIVIIGGDIYVDMECPTWKSAVDQWYERYGDAIDDYEPNVRHKFVKLYLAKMIKE